MVCAVYLHIFIHGWCADVLLPNHLSWKAINRKLDNENEYDSNRQIFAPKKNISEKRDIA